MIQYGKIQLCNNVKIIQIYPLPNYSLQSFHELLVQMLFSLLCQCQFVSNSDLTMPLQVLHYSSKVGVKFEMSAFIFLKQCCKRAKGNVGA